MTADAKAIQHPAPQADRVAPIESFFALFAGPLAWFTQLCCGFALASQPCFIDGDRSWLPMMGSRWVQTVMISAMAFAMAIALAALIVSWRAYRRTQSEAPGDEHQVMEVGAGRTRFLVLWGIILAAGFAIATALTAVAFLFVSRCRG